MSSHDIRPKIEGLILQKLDKIRENVRTSALSESKTDLQILLMVNDELDDVLLNWQISGPIGAVSFDDLDDFDFED